MRSQSIVSQKKAGITPLLVITLFAIFSFVLKDFHLPVIVCYGMVAMMALVLVPLNGGKIYVSRTRTLALMLAFVTTIMVFLPYARTSISTLSVVFSLDIAILYIVISNPTANDVERALEILFVSAFLMSGYAVLVDTFPSIYYNVIKRILPTQTQLLIELGFRYHYGIFVGGESIVVDYYAFWGMAIALNTMLISWKKMEKRNRYIVAFVVCILAIVLQNRRSELVMSILVIVFLLLSNVNVTKAKKKWKQILILCIISLLGVAAFLYMLNRGYLSRYEVFFTSLDYGNSGVINSVDIGSGRIKLWERAFDLFKQHPWFGIGWGNFRLYLSDTFNVFNDGQLSNAHNNYLQLLCETGIVGFVFFAGPLFFILIRTFKRIRQLRESVTTSTLVRIAASTSLSFQLFFLGLSFIDPVWYKMFTWPFYGIAIILLVFAERGDVINTVNYH